MGSDVMNALPGCSAELWLLPNLLEGNCPAKPQAAFCIAKGAMQEQEGGGCKGKATGWRKYNYLPLYC